ncbi:MAG: hypothetical protein K8H86_07645 [Ignavibacteriaceae bacterium]|nr:hypothetical protein [Ignavibacteriaceae bacterium]
MKLKQIAFALFFLFVPLMSAQNKVSLTNLEKTKEYLSLSEKQYELVKQNVKKINAILEEDKKIIAELKKRVENDDEPGFFEKISVKRGRDGRASDIEDLLEEIEDKLTDEQKVKFEKIEKPELKGLSKEEIFGK